MTQLLPKKNPKKLIFESSLFNYSEKWLQITWKCENWKWPLVSLTSIFTASTWSIIKSRDSFEILRTCRFKNWPNFLNLVKIWGSYCQKTKKRNSENHPLVLVLSSSLLRQWCTSLGFKSMHFLTFYLLHLFVCIICNF